MKIERMNKGSWGKVRAFFDVTTSDGFTIKGFKIIEGINGLFVSLPSQKGNDDEYYDTIWLTEEVRESMREKLNKMAVEEYNKDNTVDPVMDIASESSTSETHPPQTSEEDTQTTEKLEAPFSEDDLPF